MELFRYKETGSESPTYEVSFPQAIAIPTDNAIQSLSDPEVAKLLAQARTEGMQQGEASAEARFQEMLSQERKRISDALEAFRSERAQYYAKVEAEIVRLALAIAEKILHRETQIDRMVLSGLVRVAIENLQNTTVVNLRINPAAAPEWKSYFEAHKPAGTQVSIIEDAKVGGDNCVLETDMGSAELGIDAQLKEIEQGFFDLLAHRPRG